MLFPSIIENCAHEGPFVQQRRPQQETRVLCLMDGLYLRRSYCELMDYLLSLAYDRMSEAMKNVWCPVLHMNATAKLAFDSGLWILVDSFSTARNGTSFSEPVRIDQ